MPIKTWAKESNHKILKPSEIERLCAKWKEENKRIVTVNGSFDLMHAGHLQQLFEASQLGDVVIVALNSDESIQKYKSKDRPIIPLQYRMQMMSALSFVDYVTYFEETDPIKLLEKIQPDIHVNGSEYGEDCIEAKTVKDGGGRVHVASFVPGLSTTNIIKKIKLCD